jgi:hypothetical protein
MFPQVCRIKRNRRSGSIGLGLGLDWLDLFGSHVTESIDDLSLTALFKRCSYANGGAGNPGEVRKEKTGSELQAEDVPHFALWQNGSEVKNSSIAFYPRTTRKRRVE